MNYTNEGSYQEWVKEALVGAQMLAFRNPEAGIASESLVEYSSGEIIGIYRYLRRINDAKHA